MDNTPDLDDVVVVEQVPVRYSLTEGWGSEMMTDDRWSYPWDGAKLADYAEAILAAYDACQSYSPASTQTADRQASAREVEGWIAELLQAGESMVDVPALLGMTMEAMWKLAWFGRRPHYMSWDDGDWLLFESVLESIPKPYYNFFVVGQALGLTSEQTRQGRDGLRRLGRLYGRVESPAATVRGAMEDAVA